MEADLLFRDALLVDGSGAPPVRGDLAVRGERIAAMGKDLPIQAKRTVEAGGLVLCPGFIDTHSHSDRALLSGTDGRSRLEQGITTEIIGQDGMGLSPLGKDAEDWLAQQEGLTGTFPLPGERWNDFAGYRRRHPPLPNHAAALVGYGTLRAAVHGLGTGALTPEETQDLLLRLEEAFAAGVRGLSLGLIYHPCFLASRQELVTALAAAGRLGGVMVIHLRNEGPQVHESLADAFSLATQAQIPLHVSHLKIAGRRDHGRMTELLSFIDWMALRHPVTFDQYPYTAGSTLLTAILPPDLMAEGAAAAQERLREPAVREELKRVWREGPPIPSFDNLAHLATWEGILITAVQHPENRHWVGRTVAEVAREQGMEPEDAVLDLLAAEGAGASMVDFVMDEEDVATALRHPLGMLGTDGLLGGTPHPRAFGTFPRFLGHFVRERRLLPLAEAIRKCTSLPAARFGLWDRGVLRVGTVADLVLFAPVRIAHEPDYLHPSQRPAGIRMTVVGGEVAFDRDRLTGIRAGRFLA